MAAQSASRSLHGTVNPLTPSTTTSPDSRVVICGNPHAAASQVTFAQPSHCDGKIWTVAAR